MAITSVSKRVTSGPGSAERETTVQLVNLLNILDTLTAKLDADAGVTDTNYNALFVAAVSGIKSANANTITNP